MPHIYNFNLEVKYHLIEKELLRNAIENDDTDDNYDDENCKENYSVNDVKLICSELYKNEYLKAFDATEYLDDVIDEKLRRIYNTLTETTQINYFKEFIDELFQHYLENCCRGIKIEQNEDINDVKYMCFLSLFSQELFHITHQLLCIFFKNNEINLDLLNELKQKHCNFNK